MASDGVISSIGASLCLLLCGQTFTFRPVRFTVTSFIRWFESSKKVLDFSRCWCAVSLWCVSLCGHPNHFCGNNFHHHLYSGLSALTAAVMKPIRPKETTCFAYQMKGVVLSHYTPLWIDLNFSGILLLGRLK